MLFVKEQHAKQREEVMTRLGDVQKQHEELVTHRTDVDKGIEILEQEFYRIEGELRMLEAIANQEREMAKAINKTKKNG